MSSTSNSIKPTNHHVHPCTSDRKIALTLAIISKNSDKEIIVTTSGDTSALEEEISFDNVRIFTDKDLIKDENLKCELLISFDLPAKAIIYTARLSHSTSLAVAIVTKEEQGLLYPIETLLGRVIKQKVIEGYEEKVEYVDPNERPRRKMTKDQIKEEAKKRYENSTQDKPERTYDDKKPYDKDKKPYDKDKKFDKKTAKKKGRTISITALKKKSED